MSDEKVVLACTFGWGKTCFLYHHTIEIAGRCYKLNALTSVNATFRVLFGVSSARLELCFGHRKVVLRGVSDFETAGLLVSHLLPYCARKVRPVTSHSRQARAQAVQNKRYARVQAQAWERDVPR